MRSRNTQLPNAAELQHILEKESQRKAVRYDFLDKNPQLFDVYRQLADKAGVDSRWIDRYPMLSLAQVDAESHAATDHLARFILESRIEQSLLDDLYDKLAVTQAPQKSDMIFVFGSPADVRIRKAVELYHEGFAPIIVVSGNKPHYVDESEPEAERMAHFALHHGVPNSALIIEPESITLPDNVKRALDIFEARQLRPEKIIIIATSYIMRRAIMEWYKFTPWPIEIIPVSAVPLSEELKQDGWYKSERGVRMLLNEYAKIILELKMDLMRK